MLLWFIDVVVLLVKIVNWLLQLGLPEACAAGLRSFWSRSPRTVPPADSVQILAQALNLS